MSWAVTGDNGERGPALNLIVFKLLHKIQTKKFNTVKKFGPCLGEHGPALIWNVFEKFHINQTRTFSLLWKELDHVWGNTTNRSFERCWLSA